MTELQQSLIMRLNLFEKKLRRIHAPDYFHLYWNDNCASAVCRKYGQMPEVVPEQHPDPPGIPWRGMGEISLQGRERECEACGNTGAGYAVDFPAETASVSAMRKIWEKNRHYNLMPLLNALPHLKLPENWVLDFFQEGSDAGSAPHLYVRKKEAPREPDWFLRLKKNERSADRDVSPYAKIIPEHSAAGAWELVLFHELANQFHLHRHAGFGQQRIIPDLEKFFRGRASDEITGKDVLRSLKEEDTCSALCRWNILPDVTVKGVHAAVTYTLFSPFHGFSRISRVISFSPEVRIGKAEILKHISFHCQIIY